MPNSGNKHPADDIDPEGELSKDEWCLVARGMSKESAFSAEILRAAAEDIEELKQQGGKLSEEAEGRVRKAELLINRAIGDEQIETGHKISILKKNTSDIALIN